MVNLRNRSYQKELLDGDDIPFEAIRQNMKELNTINTYLGGHAITIAGLKKIIAHFSIKDKITICEIGCGGGDNLLAIDKWCRQNNIKASFIGIDMKASCIDFAKAQCSQLDANWIVNDYACATFGSQQPDIIFSSLFCHHFNESELAAQLSWMKFNSGKGFFINDLQRHLLAFYSIKIIVSSFSSSYLVKNDAPLSVARGFSKAEWVLLMKDAGINNYTLEWKWAFRFLITSCND